MKNFLNQPFYLFIIRDYTVTPHKSHDTTFVRHQIDTSCSCVLPGGLKGFGLGPVVILLPVVLPVHVEHAEHRLTRVRDVTELRDVSEVREVTDVREEQDFSRF